MTTLELALLCSYALRAEFTMGIFDTRDTKSESSDWRLGLPAPSRLASGTFPLPSSSRMSVGDARDGDVVPEVTERAGVGWKAIGTMRGSRSTRQR